MNVRFFAGTKAQYLSLSAPRNPLALYFCEDTKELFWGDKLLTDGIRVVPTFKDLPTRADAVADGVVYYVTETRNGYVLSPDRSEWIQTIYAPATDAYTVPESEMYNTVTTVGAVRDIEAKIYKTIDERIANIEVGSSGGVKTISFAGIDFQEADDGVFTIDRACARKALGLKVPDGKEYDEVEFITSEQLEDRLASIPGADLDLSEYVKQEDLADLATKEELLEAIEAIEHPSADLTGYATEQWVNEQGFLKEHQDLSEYAKRTELENIESKIPSIEGLATEDFVIEKIAEATPNIDLGDYYTKPEVESLIPDVSEFITSSDLEAKNYITEIPEEYITAEELAAEGFIKEHQSLEDYAKTATVIKHKYEVLPVEGMLTLYSDNEIRLNTARVQPSIQTIGSGGNPNMFYVTFRAYAPDGATRVIEGQSDNMDTEFSMLETDIYGRKYTTIWAAIANTSDGGQTWTKWGDNSTVDKYLGFYYNFHWYNEETLIETDKVRVLLTNDDCHNDLVPDAVARRIDEKVATVGDEITNLGTQVQNIEQNYVSNEYLQTQEFVTNEVLVNNYITAETLESTYVTNEKLTEKVENTVTEVIQEKVDAGEIEVTVDSITYGDF